MQAAAAAAGSTGMCATAAAGTQQMACLLGILVIYAGTGQQSQLYMWPQQQWRKQQQRRQHVQGSVDHRSTRYLRYVVPQMDVSHMQNPTHIFSPVCRLVFDQSTHWAASPPMHRLSRFHNVYCPSLAPLPPMHCRLLICIRRSLPGRMRMATGMRQACTFSLAPTPT